MSSSEEQDIDLEWQKIIKPKKFNAKLIASIYKDEAYVLSPIRKEFTQGSLASDKKAEKLHGKNPEINARNKCMRRLPVAFNIITNQIQLINNNIHTNSHLKSSNQEGANSGQLTHKTPKNSQKHLTSKSFKQDNLLESNSLKLDKGIQKTKPRTKAQTYFPQTKNNLFDSSTQIKNSNVQQKTLPHNRNRNTIIKQHAVAGNLIRTNWNKGLINGYTEIDYKDRGKFRGIFEQGEIASGQMTFPNGFIYTGQFSDYKFNGFGRLKFPSGQIFQGNWYMGYLNGKVRITYPQGQFYFGQVQNFKRQGEGYLYFKNGDKYVGQFYQGEITGYGQLHKNGKCTHVGYWVKGQFIGDSQEAFESKKAEESTKKSIKRQKKIQISFDLQSSMNDIRSINQLFNKRRQKDEPLKLRKTVVGFKQDLNEEFSTNSQQFLESIKELLTVKKTTSLLSK